MHRIRRLIPVPRPLVPLEGVKTRDAMEICVFFVLVVATVRTALGVTPLPGSLQNTDAVGFPWGQLASCILCLGCAVSLVGLSWMRRITGLLIEQVGLMMAGLGSCSTRARSWSTPGSITASTPSP